MFEPPKSCKDISLGHLPVRLVAEELRNVSSKAVEKYNSTDKDIRHHNVNFKFLPAVADVCTAIADALEKAAEREMKGE